MEIIADINILDIVPLIDKKWLFTGLWKLKGERAKGEDIFNKMMENIAEYDFEPKFTYEIFSSGYDKKGLKLFSKNGKEIASFKIIDIPLSKFGKGRSTGPQIALLCATVGGKVKDVGEGMFKKSEYADYFYLNGLAAALAEALTEYGHLKICEGIGLRRENTFRISPGYPSWPEISDQTKIEKLISMDKIGVSVSETGQLVPEFSTTAMIFELI